MSNFPTIPKGRIDFMTKRIMPVLCALAAAFYATAAAAEGLQLPAPQKDIKTESFTFKIQADTKDAGAAALLRIYEQSADESAENLLWADEGKIENDGSVLFSVTLIDYQDGHYKAIASADGIAQSIQTPFEFYKYGSVKNDIGEAKEENSAQKILAAIEKYGNYLGLDMKTYNALGEEKNAFSENVLFCDFKTPEEFIYKFNLSALLTGFKGADLNTASEITDNALKMANLYNTDIYKDYKGNANIVQKLNNSFILNASKLSADKFLTEFKREVILGTLAENTDLWSSYEMVLKKYKAIIDEEEPLLIDSYNALLNQSSVIENLKSNHPSYQTLKALSEEFNRLVREQKALEDKNKTRQPSGGGGGGGKSSVSAGGGISAGASKELFSDISQALWAKEAIDYLAQRKIINGKSENIFAPNDYLTRAEAVKLLVTAFNIEMPAELSIPFDDVNTGDWFYPYLCAAYKNGLIQGITQSTFAPQQTITRQDIAVLISRIIKSDEEGADLTFSDSGEISDYAKNSVSLLYSLGIINGTDQNRFAPHENTTRAQAAKIWYNAIKTGVR